MARPFSATRLHEASFLQRVFRRPPKENAILSLETRLAQAARITEVPLETILELSKTFHTDLTSEYGDERIAMYQEFMRHCFADRVFEQCEVDDLWHLKDLLSIDDATHAQIYQSVAQEVYRREVETVLTDHSVSQEERVYLEKLRSYLAIGERGAVVEMEEAYRMLIEQLDAISSSCAITPQQLAVITSLSNLAGTGIPPEYSARLALACELHAVQTAPVLPAIVCELNLLTDETCHHVAHGVRWSELRSERVTRSSSGGLSLRVKVVKGLYFNSSPERVSVSTSSDTWTVIGCGPSYLTNKRFVIVGSARTKVIKLEKIVDFNLRDLTDFGRDAGVITIRPDSGRAIQLDLPNSGRLFAAYLARLLRDK